jgi:hypothetical protein
MKIYNEIVSNPFYATIFGGLISSISFSVLLGIWSYFKKGNFIKGFKIIVNLLMNFIKWIYTLLKQFAILVLKPLFRPILYEIISESELDERKYKKIGNETIELKKLENDDCFYLDILNLKDFTYRFKLKKIEGDYWRIGFKLSKVQDFNTKRLVPDCPLIHLTKNKQENLLRFVEYNRNNIPLEKAGRVIEGKYNNCPITIILKKNSGTVCLRVLVKNRIIFSQDYDYVDYNYSKLFAWGDGNSYKFKIQIEKFNKIYY